MKLFVDTNILLDILLNREIHFKDSKLILELIKLDTELDGYISETTIANIVYVARNLKIPDEKIRKFLVEILSFFNISNTSRESVIQAIHLELDDLEDSLQIAGAIEEECDYLITRDKQHFMNTPDLEIITPRKFIDKFLDS